jgi:hypothetical protein
MVLKWGHFYGLLTPPRSPLSPLRERERGLGARSCEWRRREIGATGSFEVRKAWLRLANLIGAL